MIKLNAAGQLVYSVLFGGTSSSLGNTEGRSIAVTAGGDVYVAGVVFGAFPTTANAFAQAPCNGAFLSRLNQSGTGFSYSSCFNGVNLPTPHAIDLTALAIDSSGKAALVGSAGNPITTTPNALQPNPGGNLYYGDAFVEVFDTTKSGGQSLIYSTYMGGWRGDSAQAVAMDSLANVYVTGETQSFDFPLSTTAYQRTLYGWCGRTDDPCHHVFVAKLSPFGTGAASLVFSTLLGGQMDSHGSGIAVDATGSVYVTGHVGFAPYAGGPSFPTTPGAYCTTDGKGGFVAKFGSTGSQLIYSTFLGATATVEARALAVDDLGNAYIAGYARGNGQFPVTPDAFQSAVKPGGTYGFDAFLMKFDSTGSALLYSTLYGGANGDEMAFGLTLDRFGNAYVAGQSGTGVYGSPASTTVPVTPDAFQPAPKGATEGFIAKFEFTQTFLINGFSPDTVGNAGSATIAMTGAGFEPGTTAILRCPGRPDLTASSVTIELGSTVLKATFNLVGVPAGSCTVVARTPSGTQVVAPKPLTVTAGGQADVWVDVIGRSQIRGGRGQDYFITYGNRGNVDSESFRVWVSFPTFLTWQTSPLFPWSSSGKLGETAYVAFDIPGAPAGGTGTVPIRIQAPDTPDFAHRFFEVQVWPNINP